MGSINWVAVVLGAGLAILVLHQFWRGAAGWTYGLQLIPALMLGHALARIGPDKLTLRPQLYFMQSSGLALAIAIPALAMGYRRQGLGAKAALRDGGALMLAYLAMGSVFWFLGR